MSYLRKSVNKQVETKLANIFTQEPFQGNPMVFVTYGQDLTVEEKTAIVREFKAAKGAFIDDADDGKSDFKLEIYSSEGELDVDYQALIGAAHIMVCEKKINLKDSATNIITGQAKNGVFPILLSAKDFEFHRLMVRLDLSEKPEFRRVDYDQDRVAESLGISSYDLRNDLLIQAVKMNSWSMIIPVKTEEVLDKIIMDRNKLFNLASDNNVDFICLFFVDESQPEPKLQTRIFHPNISNQTRSNGLEDAITGLSNPSIAAYLFEHKLIALEGSKIGIQFIQRTKNGRKGTIQVDFVIVDESIAEFYIGGSAIVVLDGKMKLSSY